MQKQKEVVLGKEKKLNSNFLSNSNFKNFFSKLGKGLQNLGKALIFPIAVLPFAALLNRFGTLAMDLNPIEEGVKNAGWWIGFILKTPGGLVFDNIALMFALGTAFGLSKDQRGEVALVGAVLYIALTLFLGEGGLTDLIYKGTLNLEVWTKDANGIWSLNKESGFSQLFYVPNFQQIDILGDGNKTLEVVGGTFVLNIGVLGGLVAGCTSAALYNRFSGIKLPQALSFFGGRRFVPMIVMLVSLPLAFLFAVLWPWIQYALVEFGQLLSSSDSWAVPGSFLYALINRLAQPFGMHHILNTFLWFQLPIEGNVVTTLSGQVVIGEDIFANKEALFAADGNLTSDAINMLNSITSSWSTNVEFKHGSEFLQQNVDLFNEYFSYNSSLISGSNGTVLSMGNGVYAVMGDINAFQKSVVSGNFQTGYFPLYWGGLTGAAVAMTMAAKKENRKQTGTFFLGVGIVAALTGIDEPLFFAFTFVAPVLWMVNALFTAIFACIAIAMHIHVGFGFSGGLIDYIISFSNAWGMSNWEATVNGGAYGVTSNPLWLIAISIIMFPTYYFTFYILIKKLDLKTPGRESGNDIDSSIKLKEINNKKADKYDVIAENILTIVGKDNIVQVGNCSTRIRLIVKDNKVGSDELFRKAGASGMVRVGTEGLQIIIGTDVEHVADSINSIMSSKNYLKPEIKEDK